MLGSLHDLIQLFVSPMNQMGAELGMYTNGPAGVQPLSVQMLATIQPWVAALGGIVQGIAVFLNTL